MYAIFTEIELGLLLLHFIFAWIAGVKASRLLYSRSAERMRKHAGKLLGWTWILSMTAAGTGGVIFWMASSLDPIFWIDRAYIQAPLILLPLLAVWFASVPKLARLRKQLKEAAAAGEESPSPAIRQTAAEPALIIPYQLWALGTLTAFYFGMVSAIPLRILPIAVPLGVLLLAFAGLWLRHRVRCAGVRKAGDSYAVPHIWKRTLAMLCVLAIIGSGGAYGLAQAQAHSLLPERLDMSSGAADYGNGSAPAAAHEHAGHAIDGSQPAGGAAPVSVADLTGPQSETPDRRFTLTAQKKTVRLSSGKEIEAWTYNGEAPGPELRMKEGELVEVTLANQDIEQGVTLHWHGLDVPNAEDGVAGVTQDAVMPGQTHTYRFRAEQVGTFWYHSHQDSQEAVSQGLFGPLIVEPKEAAFPAEQDVTVMTHIWKRGGLAIGNSDALERRTIAPGTPVRLRLINTDDWVLQNYTLVGTHFQVAAIDGTALNEPDVLANTRLVLTTGGRYDVTFVMPNHPVFLSVNDKTKLGVLMSPDGSGDVPAIPATTVFDPLHYGRPAVTPFNASSSFDREFTMILDNKLGFYNGGFNNLYTLNGEVFPNTPMFMVREGELVKTTIVNRGTVEHPMHLHGHHVLVLSRNGEPSTGSPWWSDTLDVLPGDTYEIAFRADNPGLWMDHCHNLSHAKSGMTMHLMYEGISTPFAVGDDSHNHPE